MDNLYYSDSIFGGGYPAFPAVSRFETGDGSFRLNDRICAYGFVPSKNGTTVYCCPISKPPCPVLSCRFIFYIVVF